MSSTEPRAPTSRVQLVSGTHSFKLNQYPTLRYHINHARSFLGMPMLSSLMGVFAARAGDRALSREFFDKGVASHRVDPFDQFNETSRAFHEKNGPGYGAPDSTLFLTNPAGYLMALLMGLTGMQLDSGEPAGWFRHKIVLPEGWDAIEIERLWVRGEPQGLLAEHGAERAHWTGDHS